MFKFLFFIFIAGFAYPSSDICNNLFTQFKDQVLKVINEKNYDLIKNTNRSTSETYILIDKLTNKKIGIFKPSIGEPATIGRHNIVDIYPIPQGKGYIREEIGFFISHYMNIDMVPETITINLNGMDGSLMKWEDNYESYYDFWTSNYKSFEGESVDDLVFLTDELGISQVQKMAVFDLVIGNWDRNLNNFIINKDHQIKLIDHAMSLPTSVKVSLNEINWSWNRGVHAESLVKKETASYILNLNEDDLILELTRKYPALELEAKTLLAQRIKILKKALQDNISITLEELARTIRYHNIYWKKLSENE